MKLVYVRSEYGLNKQYSGLRFTVYGMAARIVLRHCLTAIKIRKTIPAALPYNYQR